MTTHPLYGAFERVCRAEAHLAELDQSISDFRQAYHHFRVRQFETNTLDETSFEIRIPHKISILIGESCYNLRAALDYLVFQLAILDSGSMQDHTLFPLEMTSKNWVNQKKRSLKGLSVTHISRIESLQPCSGCDWTKTLALISNGDKHRHLTATSSGRIHTVASLGETFPLMSLPISSKCRAKVAGSDMEVEVQFITTCDIIIPFERRLGFTAIDTLRHIKEEVANLLEAFKPEFHVGGEES
jgi:hypothetical protein